MISLYSTYANSFVISVYLLSFDFLLVAFISINVMFNCDIFMDLNLVISFDFYLLYKEICLCNIFKNAIFLRVCI